MYTFIHYEVLTMDGDPGNQYLESIDKCRVAKFNRPCVRGYQKISEDNQELRPGCPPDYQIFCERIDPKIFIPTNLSFSHQQKQQYEN